MAMNVPRILLPVPPFAAAVAFSTHFIYPSFSPDFDDNTRCTVRYLHNGTSKFSPFFSMDSPSCPWKHYLLSNKSPVAFMSTNACSTVDTETPGSWWPTLQSHAQVLSRIKVFFFTSTSLLSHIQSYKGGKYLLKKAQFLDLP